MFSNIEAFIMTWNRRAAMYLCGGCTLFAMLVLIADAIRRTFLDRPFQAAIDIVELTLAWIVFPAFAYGLVTGAHVRMTLGVSRFPAKVRRWCEIFGNFCGTVFFAYVAYHGVPFFWISWLSKEVPMGGVPVPVWLGKFIFPIGMFMIFTVFLVRFIRSVQKPIEVLEEEKAGKLEVVF
jgi:TRAP-type C4-dicarboxylate transport system permease small subunit